MSNSFRSLVRWGTGAGVAAVAVMFAGASEWQAQVQPSSPLWLAPASVDASSPFIPGLAKLANDDAAGSLEDFRRALDDEMLGSYAHLYVGRAQVQLERYAAAIASAETVLASGPGPQLRESALWLAAEAAEQAQDWPAAQRWLAQLVDASPLSPHVAHGRLAEAAEKARDRQAALAAWTHLYYEHPTTNAGRDASERLAALNAALIPTAQTFDRSEARAERLFDGRRYADAGTAFGAIRDLAPEARRVHLDLQIAKTEFYRGRYQTARAAFDSLRTAASTPAGVRAEAEFYHLSTSRALGRHAEYRRQARAFVMARPGHELTARALDELGTHYILQDEDELAAETFATLYAQFPSGAYSDRAAWKAGWWAYTHGNFGETARIFEAAAVAMNRANYRPWWLYWAGRSHEQLGESEAAMGGYRATIANYRNSYYGRLATSRLEALLARTDPSFSGPVAPPSTELPLSIDIGGPPTNAQLIRTLLAAGAYDAAVLELRRAERDEGASPLISASLAYAFNRRGELRAGINAMRRAYPQFMSAGGEALPREVLTVIFPVDHWSLISRYSGAHELDPFLMLALIAQESTFQADIRSSANAWGLMQIIPGTGQRYARKLSIRPFSTRRLTNPEVNVRIGMKYFADLIAEFGQVAPALAAYNAGESRVRRWRAERPDLEHDEFIDDIPFPETMNYIKRIIGTAEDYRLLYEDLAATPALR